MTTTPVVEAVREGGGNQRGKGRGKVSEEAQLHPRLKAIETELAETTTRAAILVDRIDEDVFHHRPSPERWSIAECVVHLSLTTRAYLPLIDDALQIGRLLAVTGPRRFRRDFIGWLLCAISEPPYRFRASTAPRFIPEASGSRADVLAEFVRLQQDLTSRVYHAEGLDLTRLTIVSPFDGRLEYNLYSCFRILPTHQRRHLWQGERVLDELTTLAGETRTLRLAESAD
jgi:DinB superfamily